jgi:hypothetical protein
MLEAFGCSDESKLRLLNYTNSLREGKHQFPCSRCHAKVLLLILLPCCGEMVCFECVSEPYVGSGLPILPFQAAPPPPSSALVPSIRLACHAPLPLASRRGCIDGCAPRVQALPIRLSPL